MGKVPHALATYFRRQVIRDQDTPPCIDPTNMSSQSKWGALFFLTNGKAIGMRFLRQMAVIAELNTSPPNVNKMSRIAATRF